MKIIVIINLLLISLTGQTAPEDDFVMTIKTDVRDVYDTSRFHVAATGSGYNFNVDCNDDGEFEAVALTGSYHCNYTQLGGAGIYTIRIQDNSGLGTGFPQVNAGIDDRETYKILSLDQWGTGEWASLANAFLSARNMVILATDSPDLIAVTDMSKMFYEARLVEPDVSDWDVSSVTDMSGMFSGASLADPDVSDWDVSSVTDMSKMFYDARLADPDVSQWNISSLTDISLMFMLADTAEPDVSDWDVSSVTNMKAVFNRANSANPNVSGWDVSSVTVMTGMFVANSLADPDVSGWDVSSAIDMRAMFAGASLADPDVSDWNVSSVTEMSGMFSGASLADPDVSEWDVSSVTDMSGMFSSANLADPDVSSWDVSSVTDMSNMFSGASLADPDVSDWNVSSVTNMSWMFASSQSANPDVSHWDVSSVSTMARMFANAYFANPDVSDWDVSSVNTMSGMFASNNGANPNLSEWDVSSVRDMSEMFWGTVSANPEVSQWDVSSVTTMYSMFENTHSANPDVSQWDVSSVSTMALMFQGSLSADPNVINWDVSSLYNMHAMFSHARSAVPDMSSWDVTNVGVMSFLLRGVALPPDLYDAILLNFASQSLRQNVTFDAGDSFYCNGLSFRTNIINTYGWVIEDGGLNCGSDVSVEFAQNNQLFELGQNNQLNLLVTNRGYQDVTGAIVTTAFSTGHANLRWACQVMAGPALCPAENGTGDLSEMVDLNENDQLSYVFSFDLLDDSELSVTANIDLIVPEDDIYLPNNHSVATNQVSKISKYTSGAWFDAENPGHGVFLEVLEGQENQADRLNMYWFTYHDSKPIWLGGVGEIINGERVVIDLQITQGADFSPNFNAADVVAEDWGQVTMSFQGPHSVKLNWVTLPTHSAFGSGEIIYSQLSTVSESIEGCYSGSFYNPNQPGHGFYIHVTDTSNNLKQVNVSWFTYHEGALFWLVGSGIFDQNDSNSIPLAQYTGASFFNPLEPNGWSFNSDDLVNSNWGDLTLSFTNENNMNLSYQPHDTNQFESGELTVTRLTSMKGHSCN